MRKLSQYHTYYEAEAVGRMLEENGIATHVAGKYEEWAGSFFSGAAQAALWVVLDRQYDDAVQLIAAPEHDVKFKLSAVEISDLKSTMNSTKTGSTSLLLFKVIVFALLFALVISILAEN